MDKSSVDGTLLKAIDGDNNTCFNVRELTSCPQDDRCLGGNNYPITRVNIPLENKAQPFSVHVSIYFRYDVPINRLKDFVTLLLKASPLQKDMCGVLGLLCDLLELTSGGNNMYYITFKCNPSSLTLEHMSHVYFMLPYYLMNSGEVRICEIGFKS